MNPLGIYNPANFSQQSPCTIDTGLPPAYIRIINSSPYGLYLKFGGMGDTIFPEMFLEDFAITRAFNGKITFYPISNIVNPSAALTNYVAINAFYPSELVQPQAQPITTMSNLGNTVPLSASATSVANDGNPAPTNVVEATESGHATSDLLFTNDGNGRVAGLYKSKGGGAGFWSLYGWDGVSDNEALRIQTNGQLLTLQAMAFFPFTTFIGACNKFSGTVTGTYAHGLAVSPTVVLILQSAIGSETLGWDSPTAANVHITNGATAAWTGFAYAT